MNCTEQYFKDLEICDANHKAEIAVCNSPECVHQANLRRQACEQAAYLKYVQCISAQSHGANDCGCGA